MFVATDLALSYLLLLASTCFAAPASPPRDSTPSSPLQGIAPFDPFDSSQHYIIQNLDDSISNWNPQQSPIRLSPLRQSSFSYGDRSNQDYSVNSPSLLPHVRLLDQTYQPSDYTRYPPEQQLHTQYQQSEPTLQQYYEQYHSLPTDELHQSDTTRSYLPHHNDGSSSAALINFDPMMPMNISPSQVLPYNEMPGSISHYMGSGSQKSLFDAHHWTPSLFFGLTEGLHEMRPTYQYDRSTPHLIRPDQEPKQPDKSSPPRYSLLSQLKQHNQSNEQDGGGSCYWKNRKDRVQGYLRSWLPTAEIMRATEIEFQRPIPKCFADLPKNEQMGTIENFWENVRPNRKRNMLSKETRELTYESFLRNVNPDLLSRFYEARTKMEMEKVMKDLLFVPGFDTSWGVLRARRAKIISDLQSKYGFSSEQAEKRVNSALKNITHMREIISSTDNLTYQFALKRISKAKSDAEMPAKNQQ